MKDYSHQQEALGLCFAISPLPGLTWQEILALSSLIFVHKGQTGLGAGSAVGVKANGAAWTGQQGSEKGKECLHSSSLTSQLPRPKGGHVELDRFEKPCDIPLQIFPTSPNARAPDPLSFQVRKPIFAHGGYRGLGSASHGKTLWGRFIHLE